MKQLAIIALIALLIAGYIPKIIPVKYSVSTAGCVEEGHHLITPSIHSEWKARKA